MIAVLWLPFKLSIELYKSMLDAVSIVSLGFIETNIPWKVVEYCASLGEIYDIVVENMERQSNGVNGLKG
ncbi:hypothetical protein K9O30_22480 [Clostridium bowmanii]|uniref:hypothetical protein n=1 Tax=Clostridium bowmanii TaxID=132925 RepID=UPI001C0C43A6|nr:hypothetical protein [Clostridium bowmanii]MBU3192217.1 hypothetical protein [Clostridium bowmanii]MCA1076423.1 hypothetical protein [Clostridium bowmanii]